MMSENRFDPLEFNRPLDWTCQEYGNEKPPETGSERKTIPASEVGLSLTISDRALKEWDRIQGKIIQSAVENRGFVWQ